LEEKLVDVERYPNVAAGERRPAMTATYTNQPGTVDVDTVRHLISDKNVTSSTNALLSDEEIQFHVDSEPHIYLAAAEAAVAVASKYGALETVKQVGDLRRGFGTGGRVAQYHDIAKRLRANAYRGVTPFAGGLSKAGKETAAADTDRVDPVFVRGQMEHEGTRGDDLDNFFDN
jgi:hypothetical protein